MQVEIIIPLHVDAEKRLVLISKGLFMRQALKTVKAKGKQSQTLRVVELMPCYLSLATNLPKTVFILSRGRTLKSVGACSPAGLLSLCIIAHILYLFTAQESAAAVLRFFFRTNPVKIVEFGKVDQCR